MLIKRSTFEETIYGATLDERVNCAAVCNNLRVASDSEYFKGWNDAVETATRLIDARNTANTLRAKALEEAIHEHQKRMEFADSPY